MKFTASPFVFLHTTLGPEKAWATAFFTHTNVCLCENIQQANLVLTQGDALLPTTSDVFIMRYDALDSNPASRSVYYIPQTNSESIYCNQLQQAYNCFLNWYELQKTREHLIVPKPYLQIFSERIHNQLKGMSGLANILKGSYLSDLQREKYADFISGNANGLQNFFTNLWEYYQYTHNEREVKLQRFDLCDFLEELHERFERILVSQEKPLIDFKLHLNHRTKRAEITTDKRRLIIILSNILDNAINYTTEGVITWEMTTEDYGFRIKVENTDTAKEIPKMKFENKTSFSFGLGLLVAHYNTEIISGKLNIHPGENHTQAILTVPYTIV